MVATFLPVIAGILGKSEEELKEMDTTKLVESPDMIADTYHLPAYIEDMRNLLPILLQEGYLDK